MIKIILLVLICFQSFSLIPNDCDLKGISELPTLAGGRIKPTNVLAKESLKFIFQQKPKLAASKLLCLLSLNKGQEYIPQLSIKAEHKRLWSFFSVDKSKGIPIEKALTSIRDLRLEYQQNKDDSSYRKEINKVLFRIDQFQKITTGETWNLWFENDWRPINQLRNVSLNQLQKSLDSFNSNDLSKTKIEFIFDKISPFTWSILVTLLSILFLFSLKSIIVPMSLAILSVSLQSLGMFARVYISGRAPITNMYETVMFSGLGALILCLFIYSYKKNKVFLYTGLFYNICLLYTSPSPRDRG